MNDLISRKEAIRRIDEMDIPEDMCVYEIISHIEVEIGTMPSAKPLYVCRVKQPTEDMKKQLSKLNGDVLFLPNNYMESPKMEILYPEPHWTPCSEAQPKQNGEYLVTLKFKWAKEVDIGEWLDGRWIGLYADDIVAWMDLPEVWEEGADES